MNNNTGKDNSGNRNSGNRNSGDWNSGNWNSGNWNSGDWNSGDWNSGDWNSGNWNSGDWNSGNWNSASYHVGCFNTEDPKDAYFFNKKLDRQEWRDAQKPEWIFNPSPTAWVNECYMTEKEKVDNPKFHVSKGYLRENNMKEEWQKAYSEATPEDIALTKALPNFDAEVFLEITGVDLREYKSSDTKSGNPTEITIDGAVYVLKED